MSRRVRTLIVSGVLFAVLFVLVLVLPVPYVILSPGPTCNTLGKDNGPNCVDGAGGQIIVIKGRSVNATSGNLNMTTVRQSGDSITPFQAIVGWLRSDEIVVPTSSVIPPGTSESDNNAQEAAQFTESQDNAIAAASCQLKYPKRFGVATVLGHGPSDGKLVPGDVLTTFQGKAVSSNAQLLADLGTTTPKQKVTVGYIRAGKAGTAQITLGATIKDHKGGSIGISPGTICALPFSVDLGLGNEIGGPSAGTMFALGIIDKVGSQDLTGGRFIAGTGTIDAQGNVGAIGGIPLKMIAARRAGATVFLAPADNCSDAKDSIPSGLEVVQIKTLSQAVDTLLAIKAGKSVTRLSSSTKCATGT